MDPSSREDLSALMDGELAAEPTRFLLRRLEHDPEFSATWSRWHLIRACLAADPARMTGQQSDNDFAARVAAAVGAESVSPPRSRHWTRYVGGGAIAAGVAVAALMLNVPADRTATAPAPLADASPAPAVVAASLANAPANARATAPPWLLARQPTVLGAQPASANVIYGTGLMEPEYLRRATYDHNATATWLVAPRDESSAPRSVLLVPASPPQQDASGPTRH